MKIFHTDTKRFVKNIVMIVFAAVLFCGCANKEKPENSIQPTLSLEDVNENTISPTQNIVTTPVPDSTLSGQQMEPTEIPGSKDYPERAERLLIKGDLIKIKNTNSDNKEYSEKEKSIFEGGIVKLTSNEELYLVDSILDVGKQIISFESNQENGYTLSVNSCTVSENVSATGNLYAARLSGENGNLNIQLLLEVEQTTEVYEYHVFSYFIEENYEYLQKIGVLNGKLLEIKEGTFTMQQSSKMISPFTYVYPQKYVLCSAGKLVGEDIYFGIGKVPEGYYPMNNIVKLKQDILLYDRDTLEIIAKAEKDSYLMLCATDADRWIYVEDTETALFGWIYMEMDESGKIIISGTDRFKVKDVFDEDTLQYGF